MWPPNGRQQFSTVDFPVAGSRSKKETQLLFSITIRSAALFQRCRSYIHVLSAWSFMNMTWPSVSTTLSCIHVLKYSIIKFIKLLGIPSSFFTYMCPSRENSLMAAIIRASRSLPSVSWLHIGMVVKTVALTSDATAAYFMTGPSWDTKAARIKHWPLKLRMW